MCNEMLTFVIYLWDKDLKYYLLCSLLTQPSCKIRMICLIIFGRVKDKERNNWLNHALLIAMIGYCMYIDIRTSTMCIMFLSIQQDCDSLPFFCTQNGRVQLCILNIFICTMKRIPRSVYRYPHSNRTYPTFFEIFLIILA